MMRFFKRLINRFHQKEITDPEWHEITVNTLLRDIEGSGYYKADTVIDSLKTGKIIRTPVAEYKSEGDPEEY
jgi:hypothetical protein